MSFNVFPEPDEGSGRNDSSEPNRQNDNNRKNRKNKAPRMPYQKRSKTFLSHVRYNRRKRLLEGKCPIHGTSLVPDMSRAGATHVAKYRIYDPETGMTNSELGLPDNFANIYRRYRDSEEGHNCIRLKCSQVGCKVCGVAFALEFPDIDPDLIQRAIFMDDFFVFDPLAYTEDKIKDEDISDSHNENIREAIYIIADQLNGKGGEPQPAFPPEGENSSENDNYDVNKRSKETYTDRLRRFIGFALTYPSNYLLDLAFDYRIDKPDFYLSNTKEIAQTVRMNRRAARKLLDIDDGLEDEGSGDNSNDDILPSIGATADKQSSPSASDDLFRLPELPQPQNFWYTSIIAPVYLHEYLVRLPYMVLGRQIQALVRYRNNPNKFVEMHYLIDTQAALGTQAIRDGLDDKAVYTLEEYYTRPPLLGDYTKEELNEKYGTIPAAASSSLDNRRRKEREELNKSSEQEQEQEQEQSRLHNNRDNESLFREDEDKQDYIRDLYDTYGLDSKLINQYIRITNIEYTLIRLVIYTIKGRVNEYLRQLYPTSSIPKFVDQIDF